MSAHRMKAQAGFTMIELLVAMTIFSFMLMIISVGFINVVKIHNQALASNNSQDNARTAINELVRAVRDSTGVSGAPGIGPNGTLCLNDASGTQKNYWIKTVTIAGISTKVLYRGDGCIATPANQQAITSGSVNVNNFFAKVNTSGPNIVKPEVQLTVGVASNNGTTTGTGAAVACGPGASDREF